ncbi:MAG: sensor domain-containing diguanylate cyclase [Ruminococcus sp.]|nr:sensor domain-containing diguanylate cyclase [Ruminococcus sp.]MDE6784522.1 sensor domain-containing diguanylate cyclase [Ruminococcus sp.]
MKAHHSGSSSAHVKQLKNLMLFIYIFIIVTLTVSISVLTINKTDEALKTKVTSMVSALNVQMQMNLDSYLQRMETIGTLVFAEEKVYTYDATDKNNDEYESIKTEKLIESHLYGICIMENFVDFSIVYADNNHLGKMSNGTVKLFGNSMYNDLVSMINRPKTADGWSTGYMGNFKRIYYVKRIHENAVLVISFYTNELADVFEHPGGIKDIAVQLVEENNVVIYSSDREQEGGLLDPEIAGRTAGHSSVTIMDNKYLITLSDCGDNWRVVCSAPTEKILSEKKEIALYVIIIATAAAIIAAGASILLMAKIFSPVNEIVDSLSDEAHMDLLTGVYNKRTFEKRVDEALKKDIDSRRKALIIIDLDNFKGVNDTLGHAYGDKVLSGVGDIMKRVFHQDDYLGRLGGDEFCVYLNITDFQQGNYLRHIEEKCAELCEAFHHNYTGENNNYKISASIGVAVFPEHGSDFAALYRCADKALYKSKQKGKDTYTIFSGEETE